MPAFIFGSNFILRTLFAVLMLSSFLKLSHMNKSWLVLISFVLTLGISFEFISITRKKEEEFPLHPLPISLIVLSLFFFNTLPALIKLYPEKSFLFKLSYLNPIVFGFYIISLIIPITKLDTKLLSSQLLFLAVTHIASFVSSLTCAFSIRNLVYGKFFYVYPALLVIVNDISAYLVGKSIGRTPLICLSPNKTLEGFIGGCIFTFLIGTLLCYLKIKGIFLSENNKNKETEDNHFIQNIYFHNFFFSLAASFIAPFSGFLASAIKRVFEKKDFGALIPGHGGITDRFDCQVFMVFFTFYYLKGIKDFELVMDPNVIFENKK